MIYKNLLFLLLIVSLISQTKRNARKFEQLGEMLPTPNTYRNGAGAPGHEYWQQRADYVIDVELDDNKQEIRGKEKITYYNNSPDKLDYIWLQLDQNMRAKNSNTYKIAKRSINRSLSKNAIKRIKGFPDFDGGHKIKSIRDLSGKDISFTIHQTMLRLNIEQAITPGETFSFMIEWAYKINDRSVMGGRGGYEFFDSKKNRKDSWKSHDNYLYTITQWFPRLAVYDDQNGWQNKQFLGQGEFALTFGNYKVNITVPSDHIVCATGVLQNPEIVLTEKQRDRLKKATNSLKPIHIVTLDEAEKNEKSRSRKKKTWSFFAENVRDFAFGSSKKFIWDAMGVEIPGRKDPVMAMSYYLKESYGLYKKYSTEVIAHTLKVYSDYTIPYPYPVAISVEASNGMEYPMICFNFGRTEKDGTYSETLKHRTIGVIAHEIGHNFFPMIINSDERQWKWMDEGINSFVQYLSHQKWDINFPHRFGPASTIVDYMKGDKSNISPIMTNSENMYQFANNAYFKPAVALNILRETIMGPELFDHAFKEYCKRWAFKHPRPADFFRTMEDASAFDLDWFWKGWFYSTDHVDISIKNVKWFQINSKNPKELKKIQQEEDRDKLNHISKIKDWKNGGKSIIDIKNIKDFYDHWDKYKVTALDEKNYQNYLSTLDKEEKKLLKSDQNFYELSFANIGGLPMPLIIQFTYEDNSTEIIRIPAEIWQINNANVSKVFIVEKQIKSIILDPYKETADTNIDNNYFPRRIHQSRFDLFKFNQNKQKNEMQKAREN